ncbi:hypothetical protein [Prauserella endophytica]|uniref:Uncharacterized protein n=1 Tax=Prauserella endophytica TaxID=1592324 RepID=A0ABY2S1H5_9PSEU|nr:hypothetical protein [Prauserella endophytica]PXY20322.1 hypothetical protein BAY59_31270 [Prauserella coralliicola]TKG66923.1 hypothetical protein FCN18_23715 [Prauserella endophytica]
MPWLAQREGGHPHYATGQREAVFRHLGYVEVPAPGANEPDDTSGPTDDFGEPVPDLQGQDMTPGETFDEV